MRIDYDKDVLNDECSQRLFRVHLRCGWKAIRHDLMTKGVAITGYNELWHPLADPEIFCENVMDIDGSHYMRQWFYDRMWNKRFEKKNVIIIRSG